MVILKNAIIWDSNRKFSYNYELFEILIHSYWSNFRIFNKGQEFFSIINNPNSYKWFEIPNSHKGERIYVQFFSCYIDNINSYNDLKSSHAITCQVCIYSVRGKNLYPLLFSYISNLNNYKWLEILHFETSWIFTCSIRGKNFCPFVFFYTN